MCCVYMCMYVCMCMCMKECEESYVMQIRFVYFCNVSCIALSLTNVS